MIRNKVEGRQYPTSWKEIKDLIAYVELAFAGWFLYHVVLILTYGDLLIGEPSKPIILVFETVLGLAVIALGIERLWSWWGRG